MKLFRVFTLVAAVLLLAMPFACAVGKQTVDPNSGGASTTAGTEPSPDPKVTYSARNRMLYQVIDDLGKTTGARLYAGRSSSDWRTRELRMNVFVKDVPLNDLLQSISRVLRLKLAATTSEGQVSFRLTGPLVKEEETPEQKAARELKTKRQEFLSRFVALANMTVADMVRIQPGSPTSSLLDQPCATGFAKLLANTPAASMALIDGKHLLLRGSDIPQNVASEIMRTAPNTFGPSSTDAGAAARPAAFKSTDMVTVEINPGGSAASGLGSAKINVMGRSFTISFTDPASAAGKAQDQVEAAPPPEPKPEIKPDPIVIQPDGADLHKKIRLQVKDSPAALDVVQSALAEASGFAIVSDAFEESHIMMEIPKDEVELGALLDALSSAGGQNWEKHFAFIEFRDRYWASKRENMVSQAEQQKRPPVIP